MKNALPKLVLLGAELLSALGGTARAYADQPIEFANKKARYDIALAVDISFGFFGGMSKSQRSNLPGWYERFDQYSKDADVNRDGAVQLREAARKLDQAYVDAYKNEENGGVTWYTP